MSNDQPITAPGRTPLWTAAALAALAGTADGATPLDDKPCRTPKGRALDAMAIATAFESQCIETHASEQEAERVRFEAQRAAWAAEVTRTGRYRIHIQLDAGEFDVLVMVKSIIAKTVFFDVLSPPLGYVNVLHADLCDVATGDGFEPVPLTDPTPAERAAVALRALACALDAIAAETDADNLRACSSTVSEAWHTAWVLAADACPLGTITDERTTMLAILYEQKAGAAWLRATARALEGSAA